MKRASFYKQSLNLDVGIRYYTSEITLDMTVFMHSLFITKMTKFFVLNNRVIIPNLRTAFLLNSDVGFFSTQRVIGHGQTESRLAGSLNIGL